MLSVEATLTCLYERTQRFGNLQQLWVDPTHRRGGVGKLPLNDAAKVAADLGLVRVVLDACSFITMARSFFGSVGNNASDVRLALPIAPSGLRRSNELVQV